MKKISILLLVLIAFSIQAQEIAQKEIKSNIKEVIVFIEGAQINREVTSDIPSGISVLKFTNLSPFIDAKSLQVKTKAELYILSVNFQKNYLDKEKKSEQLVKFDAQLNALEDKIDLEKTHLSILNEELAFLNENRDIGGKNQELLLSNLKATADYYSQKLTSIKLKEIERNKNIEKLEKERLDLYNQKNSLFSDKDFPSGEIWVKVESATAQKAAFELNYLVENAGWFPSYDIRAKSIVDPIELVYKANVHQDTKVDWKDVKIGFSSVNPSSGGTAPEIRPYFLNYNTLPPTYNKKFNEVSGQVISADDGLSLPGVTVVFQGTTIGTTTDMDGRYSLAIPANGGVLECSFIGMKKMEKRINGPNINFSLESEALNLDEVVVTGYSKSSRSVSAATEPKTIRIRGISSMNNDFEAAPPPTFQVENQTSFSFELEKSYSLKSDNKTQTVVMNTTRVDAFYQYFAIPKIDNDAFLKAYIVDWEKLNLLEGEANLFFENTFIGKSVLDVRFAGDTLAISLGRDKNVQIKREKQKDSSSKQFIGNKKEEVKAWTIMIKNNKQQAINFVLIDQVPVPTLEEIEFKLIEKSGAKLNSETGELKWELNIDALNSKLLEVKYSLKYPKNRNLILD